MYACNDLFLAHRCTPLRSKRKLARIAFANFSAALHCIIFIHSLIVTDKVDFEPQAGTLRLKGINQTMSPHIKLGASHSLTLELHRDVTLHKDEWDAVSLKRLVPLFTRNLTVRCSIYVASVKDASDPANTADAAAIIMNEGLAYLCLLKPSISQR